MSKQEFLLALRERLCSLPIEYVEEQLIFYSEIIDDRVEEGLSEEEAVASVDPIDKITEQMLAEASLFKLAKDKIVPKRRLSVWEIVLLALGFPIWFSLLVSVAAVIFSLYASIWAVVISFWAVFGSLLGGAVGGILGGVILIFQGSFYTGAALASAGITVSGVAIFAFFGCRAATKGVIVLTKKMPLWLKRCFIKKEDK